MGPFPGGIGTLSRKAYNRTVRRGGLGGEPVGGKEADHGTHADRQGNPSAQGNPGGGSVQASDGDRQHGRPQHAERTEGEGGSPPVDRGKTPDRQGGVTGKKSVGFTGDRARGDLRGRERRLRAGRVPMLPPDRREW